MVAFHGAGAAGSAGDVGDAAVATPDSVSSAISYLKSLLQSASGRLVFPSALQATVVVNAVAADVSLPSVVVTIPAGKTIERVYAAVGWRKGVESSAAGNAINAAQQIQVRSDAPGTWRDAITLPDNGLAHASEATEGGMAILGDGDLLAEVTATDTYEFQWESADVDGASLTFHDWQCFIIVETS